MKVETVGEQLLFSTLRLETSNSIGTCFIVRHEWDTGKRGVFLVTNKHVVNPGSSFRVLLTVGEGVAPQNVPLLGQQQGVHVEDDGRIWTFHPSDEIDLAVSSFAPILQSLSAKGIQPFYRSVPTEFIPDDAMLADCDVVEDVVFVGYPNGMYDEANNLPIFRKGMVATHPSVDYNQQPITIIDASVFPGSSGSPVFLHRVGPWGEQDGRLHRAQEFHLLGVLGKVYYQTENGHLSFEDVPTALRPVVKTQQMIDLGVVYKSKCIIETIEILLRERGELPAQSSNGASGP